MTELFSTLYALACLAIGWALGLKDHNTDAEGSDC